MTIIKHEPWECPRCKTVNAPWLSQCTCKPITNNDNCNTSDISNECITILSCDSESDHEWECLGISTGGDTYRCKKCGEHRQYLLDGSVLKV